MFEKEENKVPNDVIPRPFITTDRELNTLGAFAALGFSMLIGDSEMKKVSTRMVFAVTLLMSPSEVKKIFVRVADFTSHGNNSKALGFASAQELIDALDDPSKIMPEQRKIIDEHNG